MEINQQLLCEGKHLEPHDVLGLNYLKRVESPGSERTPTEICTTVQSSFKHFPSTEQT